MGDGSPTRGDEENGPGGPVREAWDRFLDSFLEAFYRARPHEAVRAGLHEHDGRLPDWSPAGLEAEVRGLREARRKAEGFSRDELGGRRRYEAEYLLAHIERELFWLEEVEWPRRNPLYYLDGLGPEVYLSRPYAPWERRLEAFSSYLEVLPRAVASIGTNLRASLPAPYLELGVQAFGGMADHLESSAAAGIAGTAERAGKVGERLETAVAALRGLTSDLEARTPSGKGSYALGEDRLTRLLRRTEGLDLPLERLHSVAEEDLRNNREALVAACRRLEPRLDVRACVRKVRRAGVSESPLRLAREFVERIQTFLRERDVVTIPDHPGTRVEETPPYLRWNTAHLDIPGVYERELAPTFYISPPDPGWSEEMRRGYLPGREDLLFMAAHEVWPGHVLHFLHAYRSPYQPGRHFIGYGFAEGWAHYAEELCWELGLERDRRETEIGLLLAALVRNVRFTAALDLHLGRASVKEVARRFEEEACLDPVSARQQARRGTFDPAYMNYTLGKLLIRRMRERWFDRRTEPGDLRAFHDRLLGLGSPPLAVGWRAMLGDGEPPSL